MNRRTLLATCSAGITVGVTGCQALNIRNDDSEHSGSPTPEEESEDTTDSLHIAGVYADDIKREFLDGEYLLMENTGTDSLEVSRYVVEYPTGYSHQIADLVLEPGAQLVLKSRDGEDAVYQMSPPLYLRYLGADTAPLLGESGTVRVRNTEDEIVAAVSYEGFGCDGEAETSDEMRCPQSSQPEG